MPSEPVSPSSFEVLIAGGGVAALEAALALRDLAADRISVKLIAPNADFVYRPMTVREPFAYAEAERYRLEDIVHDIGVTRVDDTVASVDASAASVHTASGSEHRFDALMLALGAHIRPRYEHAITIDDRRLDELLHGLIQDVEGGYVKRVAFVVPARMAWPFPVYELALMIATRAYDSSAELAITIFTPEDAPLALFGETASRGVAELLASKHIEVVSSAYCEVPQSGQVEVGPGDGRLAFDRVVALPELDGPSLPGLPEADHGFIPIDSRCQVRGLERVFAAGDATDFPVKHGGIAAQQADIAAAMIAALAGLGEQPPPFEPVVHGMLLTGGKPVYLSAHITGGHGADSQISERPTWWPPTKIVARYLAPFLQDRDRGVRRSG